MTIRVNELHRKEYLARRSKFIKLDETVYKLHSFSQNSRWRLAAILDFVSAILVITSISRIIFSTCLSNLVITGQVDRKLLKLLRNSRWRPAAILDFKNAILVISSVSRVIFSICLSNLVKIGQVDRELLKIVRNSRWRSAAILNS